MSAWHQLDIQDLQARMEKAEKRLQTAQEHILRLSILVARLSGVSVDDLAAEADRLLS